MEGEVGRVKKSDTVDIVVVVDEYKEQKGVTIREFLTSERYTGFTKNGVRISLEQWPEFKKILDKIEV